MARTVIGIDVGTNAVRAAEVELRARPRLVRFGQVALPAGAVHEGEVADVDAVATALRRLWQEAGFKGRSVRVGLASARVIVRVLRMPAMSAAETRAAFQFTLADYVPLPPADTVFDVQRLPDFDGASDAPTDEPEAPAEEAANGRVLLAAAHREAVEPLIAALRAANLKVVAVDPLPAALVRALSSSAAGPDGLHPVEAIVSVGAGTIIVVVSRAGVPLFARTITSLSAGLVTDRISAELAVPAEEAERLKRSLIVLPGPGSPRLEQARRTAGVAVDEVLDEVADSLGYYGAQAGAQAVTRVLLTGGGTLLPGLGNRLSIRLGLPVQAADPFVLTDLGDIGFDQLDMPRLVPQLSAAIGVALGGRSKASRLDLRPVAPARAKPSKLVLAGGAAGVLLVGLASVTYMQRRGDLVTARMDVENAQGDLAFAQAAAAPTVTPAPGAEAGADQAAVAALTFDTATAIDLDWAAISAELEALSAPLGVSFTMVAGVTQPPIAPVIPPVDPTATTVAGTTTSVAPVVDAASAVEPVIVVGQLTLNGTAGDRSAVATWLETVEASPRFEGAFVANLSTIEAPDGQTSVSFSAQLMLTSTSRVDRGLPEEVTP